MKRKLLAAASGALYFLVFLALLTLQQKYILGQVEKAFATGGAILLFLPCPFLLRGYLRAQEMKNPSESAPDIDGQGFEAHCQALGLSARETEVARMICRGYRNRQIAEELFISEATVKKHASHIYEKLQVEGRKALREKILGGAAKA